MNVLAVLAATVAAFVLSATYYSVTTSGSEETPPWKLAVEIGRSLVLATVIAALAVRGDVDDVPGGLLLGLALWIGFPLVLWTGAMLWERTPINQAALHAGDWLAKLLVVAVIVSVWQ
jgi:hypothetical protein